MPRAYLSLGSNIAPCTYITAALDALAELFGDLVISSVFESESVGFTGDNFLNLVVGIDTHCSVGQLSQQLKNIEDANGRLRTGPKYSGRTLDIDILTFDDACGVVDGIELPRDEVTKNAFVLQPLAEIAPAECHAGLGVTFADLWADYREPQKLWPVEFVWRSQRISSP